MAKLTKRKLGQVRLAPGTLRGTRFIIKEVRVSAEHGPIALIDMDQMADNMKSALKLAWEQNRQSAAVNRGQLTARAIKETRSE